MVMETAICGRVALSPHQIFQAKPGDKKPRQKQWTNRNALMAMSIAGAGKGGGLLEKPVIEKTTPGRESEFDLRISLLMLHSPTLYIVVANWLTVNLQPMRHPDSSLISTELFNHLLFYLTQRQPNNSQVPISTGRKPQLRKSRKMSPPYRVMLHNDNFNKREYVVQVLMKVIPGMTVDNAVNIMQEAHHNGLSVVIICAQADAEEHCTQLRGNGLLSSIEPASGGC
ncbi:hypothetical protein RDI58_009244 [Solanum bulbocastanum]|uniref:Adaptor protein ClpS core domain-containing protein n=1 Tax=Solanum bulbocastanum TaxID=147425 RepID=A0AAN8YJA4_SOLBU